MNCQKCGTPVAKDTLFCPNCGAKVEGIPETTQTNNAPPPEYSTAIPQAKPNQKKNILAVFCVAIAFVLILILLGALMQGNGAKKVTKNYYKAIEKCSASKLLDTIPKDYMKELEDNYDLSKKEIKKSVQDYLDKYYNDFDDIRITFQEKEKMDASDFAEEMMVDVDDDFHIKKAIEYELKVRYQSDKGDTVETKSEEFVVFKYKGNWYSMDAMFLVTMAVYQNQTSSTFTP